MRAERSDAIRNLDEAEGVILAKAQMELGEAAARAVDHCEKLTLRGLAAP